MRTLAALTPASSASRSEETVPIVLIRGLEQGPVVEREAGDRRLRDAAHVGNRSLLVGRPRRGRGPRPASVPTLCTFSQSVGAAIRSDRGRSWGWPSSRLRRCRPCSPRPCSCATPPGHQPQHRAWAIALAMFALASAALATGTSTGWDNGHVPGLLPAGRGGQRAVAGPGHGVPPGPAERTARRVLWGLVLFSGFAAGVLLSAPDGDGARHRDPGREGRLRRAAPRPGRRRQRRGRDGDHRRRGRLRGALRPGPAACPATAGSRAPTP